MICTEDSKGSKVSFIGFEISKTVWSNQINIIPGFNENHGNYNEVFWHIYLN